MSKMPEPIWAQIVWNSELKEVIKINKITEHIAQRIRDNYEDYGIGLIMADGFSNVLHLVFHLKATQSLNQILSHIKSDILSISHSSPDFPEDFRWYDGHRSFSIESSQVDKIRDFVEKQKKASKDIKHTVLMESRQRRK